MVSLGRSFGCFRVSGNDVWRAPNWISDARDLFIRLEGPQLLSSLFLGIISLLQAHKSTIPCHWSHYKSLIHNWIAAEAPSQRDWNYNSVQWLCGKTLTKTSGSKACDLLSRSRRLASNASSLGYNMGPLGGSHAGACLQVCGRRVDSITLCLTVLVNCQASSQSEADAHAT